MWGFKDRIFYRFSEVIDGCGISPAGLDNCILSGLIRVHAWIYPVCVYEVREVTCEAQVLLQKSETFLEGYVALLPNDYRRILQRGQAAVREFSTGEDSRYFLRCGAPDVEIRLEDLVILAAEKQKLDHYIKQQSRADHSIGMLSASGTPAAAFDPSFRHITFRGHRYCFGVMQASIVKKLYEMAKAGDPWQHGKKLLEEVGSESFNLRSIFSRQPSWRDLIVSDGRGLYRLHPDFPVPDIQE